ncbi:hypothetical protein ADU18_0146 [Cronobacter phage PBES 02]|uniref:Superinfection immunity protein n=1 Tax=Cronobacter phage PBES 02 TaxID=1684115 RepID=A0A0K1YAC4_9CAUD|nr:hypothetical protein ADU18_0146 [Cronobacter phage PBES 02]AKY04046.1 hypothetical protein ADU18_0146 [Cronobacter phage PBES 02]
MTEFVDVMWSLFSGSAWVFVLFWLAPYFVARKREHRNTMLILALSIFFSMWPALWVNGIAWAILLFIAALTEPQYVYVPGPAGPAGPEGRAGIDGKDGKDGEKGKDADEIPLSKAGVLKPRSR